MTEKAFSKYKVTYEQFCSKPELLNNPDLVFRFQDRYCWIVRQRRLSYANVAMLCRMLTKFVGIILGAWLDLC